MAFRDRKSSRDEREKTRREERRKALSARLGGRPDQPGRSEAEREEKVRPREEPKAPAKPAAAAADADAKAQGAGERTESKPKKALKKERKTAEAGKKPKAKAEAEAPKPKRIRKKPKAAEKPRSRTRPRGEERKPSRPERSRPSRQERGKALRARGASAAKTGGKALREGAAATRTRTRAARPKVAAAGRRTWALAAPILAIPFLAFAFAERGTRTGSRAAGRMLSAGTAFLDRHVTPGRAALLVTLATAVCLIVSQFQDYRGVEVGQPGYIPVEGTVSADQVDLATPRDAHGPWLLILAGIAIAAAVAAAVTRRRALGLVISAAGVAGLLVSLVGDRAEGLDAGDTAMAYAGTNAVLLDGFYAQVAACGVLIAAGLLVALYVGATARGPAKSSRRAQGGRSGSRPRRPVTEGGA